MYEDTALRPQEDGMEPEQVYDLPGHMPRCSGPNDA